MAYSRSYSSSDGEIKRCPLCGALIEKPWWDYEKDMYLVECLRCGKFEISEDFIIFKQEEVFKDKAFILSGLSRELFEKGEAHPVILTSNFVQLSSSYPVPDVSNISEKAKKLVERIRGKTIFFGEKINLGSLEYLPSLAYARNSEEFLALIDFLREKKMIEPTMTTNGTSFHNLSVKLTADGWELVRPNLVKDKDSDQGFIAAWFHESTKESMDTICEVIKMAGFTPMRIDQEHFGEKIFDKALAEIRKSRFLIIDLTGIRPSVFFEAGFAYGLGIEAIYVCHSDHFKSKEMEFYVKHFQIYQYSSSQELKEKLADAVGSRIKKP